MSNYAPFIEISHFKVKNLNLKRCQKLSPPFASLKCVSVFFCFNLEVRHPPPPTRLLQLRVTAWERLELEKPIRGAPALCSPGADRSDPALTQRREGRQERPSSDPAQRGSTGVTQQLPSRERADRKPRFGETCFTLKRERGYLFYFI